MARLQRIRRLRAPLAAHDEAAGWLADHPDAPELPADLAAQLAEARQRLDIARQQLQAEQARHANLVASRDAIMVDAALLAEAADIERLAEQAGMIDQALADILKCEGERASIVAHGATLLHQLGAACGDRRSGAAAAAARGGDGGAAADRPPPTCWRPR